MKLETSRLYLRPFKPSDIIETYLKALNDISIIGQTESRHKKWDKKSATDFVKSASTKTSKIFGVFIKETHKPIGNIRIFNIHSIHMRAELSFLFYDKQEWSKGYGTEALEALLNYGFNELNLHRIVADYYATNTASEKVFGKLEFIVEGVFKDHFVNENNEFVDSIRVAKFSPRAQISEN